MKITRKQLRRLIESTIREADGMVPGDTASQIAAQDLTSKATSRIQDRDEKEAAKRAAVGDKWGTGAGMADPVLKGTMARYFWKLFDRANRKGVRTPSRYMGPYGHRPKWFSGFLKAVNQAFFDSGISSDEWGFFIETADGQAEDALGPQSKKLVDIMVGMVRGGEKQPNDYAYESYEKLAAFVNKALKRMG